MGLFGYNRRDFEKNTQSFKQRIKAMLEAFIVKQAALPGGGDDFEKTSIYRMFIKFLSLVEVLFDNQSYRFDSREYKFIDSEIDKRLVAMENDIENNRMESLLVRMLFLIEETYAGRECGRNVLTSEEREAELVMAESLEKHSDGILREEKNAKRRREIITEAMKVDEKERGKLRPLYNELANEMKILENEIKSYKDNFIKARKIIKSRELSSELDKLSTEFCVAINYWRHFRDVIYDVFDEVQDRFITCRYPPPDTAFLEALHAEKMRKEKEKLTFDLMKPNIPGLDDIEQPDEKADAFDLALRRAIAFEKHFNQNK